MTAIVVSSSCYQISTLKKSRYVHYELLQEMGKFKRTSLGNENAVRIVAGWLPSHKQPGSFPPQNSEFCLPDSGSVEIPGLWEMQSSLTSHNGWSHQSARMF